MATDVLDGWDLEDFDGRRRRSDLNVPRVTVQRKGNMGLNYAAFRALGEPEAVVFQVDKGGRGFAMRPAKQSEKTAYPIRRQNAAYSYVIGARSFTGAMGWGDDTFREFIPTIVGNRLLIDLRETGNSDGAEK